MSILSVIALFGPLGSSAADLKQWLLHAVITVGLPAVFLVLGLESMGFPLPGETILVFAGVLAGQGKFNLLEVIAVGTTATILGDNAGYWVGRRGGRPLVDRIGHRIFLPPKRMDRAEHFFEQRGGPAVALARFFPGLRVAGAFAAGTSRMRWLTFLPWNCLGGIVWVTMVASIGFALGPAYKTAERYFGIVGASVVTVAAIVVTIVIIIRRHRTEDQLDETFVDPDDADSASTR
ncbi:MAG: DedA family protein [Thermoleophilia bacterium]|nr:DedA family protein [Thermoleophilia bacterium]